MNCNVDFLVILPTTHIMFKHAIAVPQPQLFGYFNNTFLSFSLLFIARLRSPGGGGGRCLKLFTDVN